MSERPLLQYAPELAAAVRFAPLGDYPTPVQSLNQLIAEADASDAFIKRDDESATVYGGNKVRTLEVLFGEALARGARDVFATGAFGSNHATATVLHAPRVGLRSGAVLFPQPPSLTARQNFELVASRSDRLMLLRHWAQLPFAMWRLRTEQTTFVMPPGGATPLGALGYVSAALELAQQVSQGQLPEPRQLVVGVGSTCTSAGLLVGLRVARALGLAFRTRVPQLIAIRVSPWPVTSPLRIAELARRTSVLLARLSRTPGRFDFSFAELRAGLTVDPRFIGAGYGLATASGRRATERFGDFGARALDTTYSAKSAAGFLACVAQKAGPTLYWATKSSCVLPEVDIKRLERLPERVRDWCRRCQS